MKLSVKCPKCGTASVLEVPEGAFDKAKGDVMAGRILPGKVCEHGFKIDFNRAGEVIGYHELDELEEKFKIRPVRFTVKSAIRNLGVEIVSAVLTAGVSEQTIVLVGSLAVTMGLRDFMERLLPDSVDVGAALYMVTHEEYEELPDTTKQYMTVDVRSKKILNSVFDEDQLMWIQKVLLRANMLTNDEAADSLVLTETAKLRTTVSLLRHLASRRGAGLDSAKTIKELEANRSSE